MEHKKDFETWFNELIDHYKDNKFLYLSENISFFKSNIKNILDLYDAKKPLINDFGISILRKFHREERFINKIHSFGYRLKDKKHLAEKIIRKKIERPNINITADNFFSTITDLAGLRILQLYKTDITEMHNFICNCNDWNIAEPPIAYNFSPRFVKIFKELEVEVKEKPTGYSSTHYVVQSIKDSDCYCEIQVRTLFEEGWSQIDHTFNYPVGKPGKICNNLLETLKRVCDIAVYLADQVPEIYEAEKKLENPDDLEFSMSIIQNTLVKNLQDELDLLKGRIKHYSDF